MILNFVDCLFLDIYVPAQAIQNPSIRLPVISWFFGGEFIRGGKDLFTPLLPIYDGRGPIEASGGNIIFLTSNYRVSWNPLILFSLSIFYLLRMRIQLGAFGFLAGTTMEKEGLPNAGLYDQRAVLQWIQHYIYLIGGDKRQVSAWGPSAGATSILHHLTAFGGTQDPLFSKAILKSPAYWPSFDRRGGLRAGFSEFCHAGRMCRKRRSLSPNCQC